MSKVFVIDPDYGIRRMFLEMGWFIADDIEQADVIQFTGGEDVDPSYYGEAKHAATRSNPKRDAYEASIYNEYVGKIPMAGICRGAQFLNVMNGGSLWQHVTNHAIGGTHEAFCRLSEIPVQVTSTHHQMMRPGHDAKILMTAQICQSKQSFAHEEPGALSPDIEAVFYPSTKSLCYQPHPEFVGVNHECRITYFKYLERLIIN